MHRCPSSDRVECVSVEERSARSMPMPGPLDASESERDGARCDISSRAGQTVVATIDSSEGLRGSAFSPNSSGFGFGNDRVAPQWRHENRREQIPSALRATHDRRSAGLAESHVVSCAGWCFSSFSYYSCQRFRSRCCGLSHRPRRRSCYTVAFPIPPRVVPARALPIVGSPGLTYRFTFLGQFSSPKISVSLRTMASIPRRSAPPSMISRPVGACAARVRSANK